MHFVSPACLLCRADHRGFSDGGRVTPGSAGVTQGGHRAPKNRGEQPPGVGTRFPPPPSSRSEPQWRRTWPRWALHRGPLGGKERGDPEQEDGGPRGLPPFLRTAGALSMQLFVHAFIYPFIHSFLLNTYCMPGTRLQARMPWSDSDPASLLTGEEGEAVYRQSIKPTSSEGNRHRAKTGEQGNGSLDSQSGPEGCGRFRV